MQSLICSSAPVATFNSRFERPPLDLTASVCYSEHFAVGVCTVKLIILKFYFCVINDVTHLLLQFIFLAVLNDFLQIRIFIIEI